MAQPDHKGVLGQPDRKEYLEQVLARATLEVLGHKGLQVLLDHPDQLDQPDLLDHKEILVRKVVPEPQAIKVRKA